MPQLLQRLRVPAGPQAGGGNGGDQRPGRPVVDYAALHDQVLRMCRASLQEVELHPEQRVLMLIAADPQFVVIYLAAIQISDPGTGVDDPESDGVAELLADYAAGPGRDPGVRGYRGRGRGRCAELTAMLADQPLTGENQPATPVQVAWPAACAAGPPDDTVYPTTATRRVLALRLGTTGRPKAAVHQASRWCARRTAPRCSGSAATTAPVAAGVLRLLASAAFCSRCRVRRSWCQPSRPDLIADAARMRRPVLRRADVLREHAPAGLPG